jgi:hypothetical protein
MAKAKGGPSKMKMVEDSMRELGDATPKAIQAHIKQKYGADISTTMISSYKSNIRKKGGGGGRGGADANVNVRDIALIRDLLNRIGANQVQALIKALTK